MGHVPENSNDNWANNEGDPGDQSCEIENKRASTTRSLIFLLCTRDEAKEDKVQDESASNECGVPSPDFPTNQLCISNQHDSHSSCSQVYKVGPVETN